MSIDVIIKMAVNQREVKMINDKIHRLNAGKKIT